MAEELDLSLPERAQPRGRRGGRGIVLWLVLAVLVVNIAFLLTRMPGGGGGRPVAGGLSAEAQKQLALRLEEQGLYRAAAQAWREYLGAAGLAGKDAARIWYRIGTVCQGGEAYEDALDAFYRSESLAKLDGLELEIGRRVQECLERLGKFAALRRALNERVTVGRGGGTTGTVVVAEIGSRKISREELDQRIDEAVERQLAAMASFLPEEERLARKEAMFKQFSSSDQRRQFLSQYVIEELLYREARDSKLDGQPDVQALLLDQERSLLAAKVLERDVSARIHISAADVATYYEAHKSEFVGKEDQKPQTLEDVKGDIYRRLLAQKQQELQQALFAELQAKHDVVIHQSAFAGDGAPTAE